MSEYVSGDLLLTMNFDMRCILSSISTYQMEGVTIIRVYIIYIDTHKFRCTLNIVTPSMWYVESNEDERLTICMTC